MFRNDARVSLFLLDSKAFALGCGPATRVNVGSSDAMIFNCF